MKKIIDEIVVNVAELPDRNSPDDWPDAMLVTGEELTEIIEAALEGYAIVPADQASQPPADADDIAWDARIKALEDAAQAADKCVTAREAAVKIRGMKGFGVGEHASQPQEHPTHQHYKGGLYRKLIEGRRESDLCPMVAYRALVDGTVWFRTLDEFERKFTPLPAKPGTDN